MTRPIVRIYSAPGEFIDREMNDKEFAQYEIDQAEVAAQNQAKLEKASEKAALLNRLGITEDEAKLLLA